LGTAAARIAASLERALAGRANGTVHRPVVRVRAAVHLERPRFFLGVRADRGEVRVRTAVADHRAVLVDLARRVRGEEVLVSLLPRLARVVVAASAHGRREHEPHDASAIEARNLFHLVPPWGARRHADFPSYPTSKIAVERVCTATAGRLSL